MGNPLLAIRELGQSIWLDNFSRELLDSGTLARLIAEDGISGVTSNPTIFEKAIGHSSLYDRSLSAAAHDGLDARAIFFKLAYADIQEGAELLRPTYDAADGQDGQISFELPPELSHDAAGSIEAAKRIKGEIDRPNVFIKVPATAEGVEAFRELTAAGVSVNVTLLFAVDRYEEIANAWIDGLERRVEAGEPVDRLASVASFFVSRVDTKVDARLEELGRADLAGPEAQHHAAGVVERARPGVRAIEGEHPVLVGGEVVEFAVVQDAGTVRAPGAVVRSGRNVRSAANDHRAVEAVGCAGAAVRCGRTNATASCAFTFSGSAAISRSASVLAACH